MIVAPSEPQFDAQAFLKTLTERPGVYRYFDQQGNLLYVGKARNLKKRVSSYFAKRATSPKQHVMLSHLARIEVTVTHTESEALLLESQLIKHHQPRYNITLRDDKSYPFLYLTTHQEFPRLTFHRGAKRREGRYFGPFPSAGAVRETLKLLKKIFPVRQCEDSFYRNRSRPCLEYQIGRCTAPCVGLVTAEAYRRDVDDTVLFLAGKSQDLLDDLVKRMEHAAAQLDFERAAYYRDQISRVRTVLEKQYVQGERGDLDIVACVTANGVACVQLCMIRGGQRLGEQTYFPATPEPSEPAAVLSAFVAQYYLDHEAPKELLLSHAPSDTALLADMLELHTGHPVHLVHRPRGERARWLQLAYTNAVMALSSRTAALSGMQQRCDELGATLGCAAPVQRIECFDISHTQGAETVASCVVFDRTGAQKSSYRLFNISGVTPGDDFAAIGQAVKRRFQRIKNGETPVPDVLLIDGGAGQLQAALATLQELAIDNVTPLAIAKGPERKPGMETILSPSGIVNLRPGTPAFLLLQQVRDEAHRFAVAGHRRRRGHARRESALDGIAGLGPKRRQLLLKQFGGIKALAKASPDALASIEGISRQLAQRIYETFHGSAN